MKHKFLFIQYILVVLPFCVNAQSAETPPLDSIEKILDKRYTGGAKAFFTHLARTIRYPTEARENCRMGTVLIDLKIKPSGALDSLSLKNEVELGMGIEDEIIRTIVTTKGKWVTSEDYTLLPFAITFQIEGVDKSKKSKFTDHLVVVAYGIPATPSAHCVSTDDLIKKFEKAKKKQDKAEMLAHCEELLRRLPESAEYKTEWTLLKNK